MPIFLFFAALVFAVVAALVAPPAPAWQVETQPRLNAAAPVPHAAPLVQVFVAAQPGLSAVEVLPALAGTAPAPLTLRLEDAHGVVGAATLTVWHNTPARLNFAPQTQSGGRAYTLTMQAETASVWWFEVAGRPGAVKLTTTYTLTPAGLMHHVGQALRPVGWWLAAWLTLFAPGLLMLNALNVRPRWGLMRWGLALALSLSAATLAWFVAGWLGAHWTPSGLRLVYGAAGVGVVGQTLLLWRTHRPTSPHPLTWAVLAVVGLGWAGRVVAAHPLILPAWVDSPHHYILARLVAEVGTIPTTYAPVLPVPNLTYHPGIYPVLVTFQWLSGATLAETFLWLGQWLNALMPLAVAAAALWLTGQPRAALGAAWVVGVVSFFPAYYLSWGRYSQLIGLLELALVLGLAWQVSVRRAWALGLALAVLLGALALTHYRVVIFAALALGVLWLFSRWPGRWRLMGAGALAGWLAAPWLWHLAEPWLVRVATNPATLAATNNYNVFPWEYFAAPLQQLWLLAALGAAVLAWFARAGAIRWLGAWVALTLVILNLGPGSWLVNNNAWAISLFVPGALALGWGVHRLMAEVGHRLQAAHPVTRLNGWLAGALLAGVLGAASAHGAALQTNVLNAQTVLARAEDAALLRWVEANLPRSAYVAVSSWRWLGNTWSGSDAGAWLWPLWGIRTTAPPLDYTFDPAWSGEVNTLHQHMAALTGAEEAWALLRQHGLTHVVIGARGGNLRPEWFAASPLFTLLYTDGVGWVFAVNP